MFGSGKSICCVVLVVCGLVLFNVMKLGMAVWYAVLFFGCVAKAQHAEWSLPILEQVAILDNHKIAQHTLSQRMHFLKVLRSPALGQHNVAGFAQELCGVLQKFNCK